jgi:hypothetical protein
VILETIYEIPNMSQLRILLSRNLWTDIWTSRGSTLASSVNAGHTLVGHRTGPTVYTKGSSREIQNGRHARIPDAARGRAFPSAENTANIFIDFHALVSVEGAGTRTG